MSTPVVAAEAVVAAASAPAAAAGAQPAVKKQKADAAGTAVVPAKKATVLVKKEAGVAVAPVAAGAKKPTASATAVKTEKKTPAPAAAAASVKLPDNRKRKDAPPVDEEKEEAPAAPKKPAAAAGKKKAVANAGKVVKPNVNAPRILAKLKSMQKPKQINVNMMKLPKGEYCLSPETWNWDFIGLKAVSTATNGTKRCYAYWILPDGREAEPLMWLKGRHSYYSCTWSNENPEFPDTIPALSISTDLQPDEPLEQVLKTGDEWVLQRLYDLNEFIFGSKKSPATIDEGDFYKHRMCKAGKVSKKTGETMRNQFRQKIPHKNIIDPADLANKNLDASKRRVIDRKVDIKLLDNVGKKLDLEQVHQKPTHYDAVARFMGLVYVDGVKTTAPWQNQIMRFTPVLDRQDRYDLPSMPDDARTDGDFSMPASGEEAATGEETAEVTMEGEEGAEGTAAAEEGEEVAEGGEASAEGEEAASAAEGEEGAGEEAAEGSGDAAADEAAAEEPGEEAAAEEEVVEEEGDGDNAAVISSA